MKKIIAIAFADLHLHSFPAFAKDKYDRFKIRLKVLDLIVKKGIKNNCPILFAGDLFHDPKELSNYIITETQTYFGYRFNSFNEENQEFICISGNHDQSEKNTRDNKSPTYLGGLHKVFDKVKLIDNKYYTHKGINYFGIPYLNDEDYFFEKVKEFNKVAAGLGKSILLIHRDLPNCKTPAGFMFKEIPGFPKNPDKLFSNFNLVLSGHIHRPTILSSKLVMLGAPIHQDSGDVGCKMGYWEIYEDFSMKLITLNHLFPNFVKLTPGEEPYNDKDYFIQPELEELEDESITEFSNKSSNKALVKKYLKRKGIKSMRKKKLLVELLNQGKND